MCGLPGKNQRAQSFPILYQTGHMAHGKVTDLNSTVQRSAIPAVRKPRLEAPETWKISDAERWLRKTETSKQEEGLAFPNNTAAIANNGWNKAGGPNLGLDSQSSPQDAADSIRAHGGTEF